MEECESVFVVLSFNFQVWRYLRIVFVEHSPSQG